MLFNVFAGIGSVSFTAASKGLCLHLCWKQCCWKHRDAFITAEQHLHTVKACFAPHITEKQTGGCTRGWKGGGTVRTGDLKGHPTPYGVTLDTPSWERRKQRCDCPESWCLLSQVTITHDGVNEFLVLLCLCGLALNFPIKLFCHPTTLLSFTLPTVPHPTAGS